MALLRDNPTFSLLISEAAVNMWYVVECKKLDSQSQIQHFWCSFQLFFKEKAKKSTELLPACTTIVLNVNYRISAYFHRIWPLFRNCNILLTQMFKWPKGRKQCSDFVTFWPLSRDMHIECSKQFKWNLNFYVSGQSGPFWAHTASFWNIIIQLTSHADLTEKLVSLVSSAKLGNWK